MASNRVIKKMIQKFLKKDRLTIADILYLVQKHALLDHDQGKRFIQLVNLNQKAIEHLIPAAVEKLIIKGVGYGIAEANCYDAIKAEKKKKDIEIDGPWFG